jgi:hypothetical protein
VFQPAHPLSSEFDPVIAEECRSWEAHRRLLLAIPATQTWRGCVGLGLVVNDASNIVHEQGRVLIPDRDVRWVSVIDVPRGSFRIARPREVHWATVRRTGIRYGMPTLSGEPEASVDFRARPRCRASRCLDFAGRGSALLTPVERTRLFRVFNAVNWSMTAAAFSCRRPWRARRQQLPACHTVQVPRTGLSKLPAEPSAPSANHSQNWMPVAYLAFRPSDHESIFDWSLGKRLLLCGHCDSNPLGQRVLDDLRQSMPVLAPCSGTFVGTLRSRRRVLPTLELQFQDRCGGRRTVTVTDRARLRVRPAQAVRDGELVANDWPEAVPRQRGRTSPPRQWDLLMRARIAARDRFDHWLRLWFERQFVAACPNFVHVPAALAAPAALGHAVDEGLFWDLSPAMRYFDEATDAFVFPPLPIKSWWDFAGVLPGEVAYDLTPTDGRYVPPARRAGRRGRNGAVPFSKAGRCPVLPRRARGGYGLPAAS